VIRYDASSENVDGQLKTGRDVVIAALLGTEEIRIRHNLLRSLDESVGRTDLLSSVNAIVPIAS